MIKANLKAPLEAVLFASGNPVPDEQLMEILNIDKNELDELIAYEQSTLSEHESGLMIKKVAGGWQMVTRPSCFEYVEKMARTVDSKLSKAALETLSIVAFRQPITKQEIESIRGVSTERILSTLLSRDLICEAGRKKAIGRPILYGTTNTFLRVFGLNALSDLPKVAEIGDDTKMDSVADVDENHEADDTGKSNVKQEGNV